MKLAKMLGLAVIAALALAAFGGASTASAVGVLCKVHPTKEVKEQPPGEPKTVDLCPEAQVYPANSPIKAQLKPGTTSNFVEQAAPQEPLIECQASQLEGETTESQPTVTGQLTVAQFMQEQPGPNKCSTPGVPLVDKVWVEPQGLPYKVSAQWEQQELSQDGTEQVGSGKVIAEKSPAQGGDIKFEFRQFTILGEVRCKYELKPAMEGKLQGKVINGSNPGPGSGKSEEEIAKQQQSQLIFDGSQAEFRIQVDEGPGTCSESGKYVASYEVKGEQNGQQIDLYIAKEKV